METIKIAHLYYDLMNLYGEHGNVLGLIKSLEEHHFKVITHYYTIDDKIPYEDYDIFYIGSGNNENFKLTLKDILKRKKEIKKEYEKGKFFLITGNAINLFGSSYEELNGDSIETLNILKYKAAETDFRIVGEQVYLKENCEEIIGFQNRSSVLKDVLEENLFKVKEGTGYAPNKEVEGIVSKNFYGTYLLGPIMIRNPYFKEFFIKEICKYKGIDYKENLNALEKKAYNEYKKNLLNESES